MSKYLLKKEVVFYRNMEAEAFKKAVEENGYGFADENSKEGEVIARCELNYIIAEAVNSLIQNCTCIYFQGTKKFGFLTEYLKNDIIQAVEDFKGGRKHIPIIEQWLFQMREKYNDKWTKEEKSKAEAKEQKIEEMQDFMMV